MKRIAKALLNWMERYTAMCAADSVMVEMGYKNLTDMDWGAMDCIEESEQSGTCWCGKYKNGKKQKPNEEVHQVIHAEKKLPF